MSQMSHERMRLTLNIAIIYRQIFVYTFCLINICLSLPDDANKVKTLNIERHNSLSFL